MSKASRRWKELCKRNNRLIKGGIWTRKDMTLGYYKALKRDKWKFNHHMHVLYLGELFRSKGII